MRVSDFVPPAAVRLAVQLRGKKMLGQPLYASYEEAHADGSTYTDPLLVEAVCRKTIQRREYLRSDNFLVDHQMAQNLFVLSQLASKKPIEVIELGGACGATFFEAVHFLDGQIRSWQIVETPEMVKRGKQEFGNGVLRFHTHMPTAVQSMQSRDLAMALGVFEYMPDPEASFRDLLSLGCKNVYVSRTMVSTNIDQKVITRQQPQLSQHGPGLLPSNIADRQTSQVLSILPEALVRSLISESGYTTVCEFQENNVGTRLVGGAPIHTRHVSFLLEKM